MTLADLKHRGIDARLDGDDLKLSAPPGTMTPDLLAELKPQKPALIAELKRRGRRDELLMMLADNPGIKYAYTVDNGTDPVILAIGIRDFCTFEMTIAADKYDPFAVLQLFEGQ